MVRAGAGGCRTSQLPLSVLTLLGRGLGDTAATSSAQTRGSQVKDEAEEFK